jgi:AcrR family transcriptional regulator
VATKNHRLGRPPASSSAETRGRIIDGARRCFADHGYEATTNKMIADAAGITTGAIYHYFDSKLHIYQAVLDEVQERVYYLFETAERTCDSFVDKLGAVYEAAHELNRADTSLAQFLGASRIDRRRNPELAEVLGSRDQRGERFFDAIVQRGIETGEIDAADQSRVLNLIRAFNIGLTDGLSGDHDQHRQAVDGLMLALHGMVDAKARAATRTGS